MNTEQAQAAQKMSVEDLKAKIDATVEEYKAATVKATKVKLAGMYTSLVNIYNQRTSTTYVNAGAAVIKPSKKPATNMSETVEAPVQPVVVPEQAQAAIVPTEVPAVSDPAAAPKPEYRKPKSLTVAECEDIFTRVKATGKRTEIAREYNVHPSTIADVMGGRTVNSKHLKVPAATEAPIQ